MKVKSIGSNMTEVSHRVGTFLVSYETPVAACLNDGSGFVRTEKRWSVTTSKHINKWLDGATAKPIPQAEIDSLFAGGTAS